MTSVLSISDEPSSVLISPGKYLRTEQEVFKLDAVLVRPDDRLRVIQAPHCPSAVTCQPPPPLHSANPLIE